MHGRTAISTVLLAVLLFGVSCSRIAKRADDAIVNDIKAAMFSDPVLKAANITVTAKDGVVTLTGDAPDDGVRLAAERLAGGIKGVSKVDDQIVAVKAPMAVAQSMPPPASEPVEKSRRKPAPERKQQKPVEEALAPAPVAPLTPDTAQNVPAAPAATPTPAPPPPPQPRTVTVPAGAILTVRTTDGIDSRTNHTGEIFRASLDAPIVVDNHVIVPAGGDAYIKLTNARSEGRVTGRNELTLELASVVYQGKTFNVTTSDVRQAGGSRGKSSAAKIGGGAAVGALIGAIAGGGKGAAIGAAIGGGAGTGLTVFKKGKDLQIPSETRLDFTLQQPFDITYFPGRAR